MEPTEIHEFVRLFNQQEFFEAHEALEDLWRVYPGPDRPFLQGLIQVAVALEHSLRGNPKGARGVLHSAEGHLAPYRPDHRGFDLEKLLEGAARHIGDPENHPVPRLPAPEG